MFGTLLPATLALLVGAAFADDEKPAPAAEPAAEDSAEKARKARKAPAAANKPSPKAAARPGVARPAPATRRPPGHAHPAPNYRPPVAHHAPAPHRPVVHRAPSSAAHAAWNARHAPRGWVRPWRPGYPRAWYHGVFVYGPGPVAGAGPGGHPGPSQAPKKEIDHAGKFSFGIRGGSYLSGYDGGASYGDAGLGLAARYRIADPVGLEVQWTYHDQSWSAETERIQQPISTSLELFAFPWTRVNPYLLGGVTVTPRNVYDNYQDGVAETEKTLWGPHVGLGLEVNLTKEVSINADARYIGYIGREDRDPSVPAAFQGNLGVNFYF